MLLIKNVETIVSTTKHPTKDPLITLASLTFVSFRFEAKVPNVAPFRPELFLPQEHFGPRKSSSLKKCRHWVSKPTKKNMTYITPFKITI